MYSCLFSSKFRELKSTSEDLIFSHFKMKLPKFLLGDNTDFPDDIFIIHMDYPRFIINLKDDEVEFLEEPEDLDEAELNAEMEGLIEQANAFYDREIARFEEE